MRLQRLLKDGLIKRRIVKGWVGYVYSAEKLEKVVKIVKSKLKEILYSIELML